MKSSEIDHTIHLLEQEWKSTCGVLDQQEKALVETYLGFLRSVAKACIEKGWRVWFRPNQVVHWGEGGFGSLSVLLPEDEPHPVADLPAEIHFLRNLADGQRLGEEISLKTLDHITYEPDRWQQD